MYYTVYNYTVCVSAELQTCRPPLWTHLLRLTPQKLLKERSLCFWKLLKQLLKLLVSGRAHHSSCQVSQGSLLEVSNTGHLQRILDTLKNVT